jgi:hypothetical protein
MSRTVRWQALCLPVYTLRKQRLKKGPEIQETKRRFHSPGSKGSQNAVEYYPNQELFLNAATHIPKEEGMFGTHETAQNPLQSRHLGEYMEETTGLSLPQ